jgi:protoheme IX farnesyltransferase
MPHFYAIGWMHREDYERAGFSLLPVIDCSGRRISRQALLFITLLIITSLLPYFSALAGTFYMVGALILGIAFLVFGFYFAASLTRASAQILFGFSALYLPVLLLLLIMDKTS